MKLASNAEGALRLIGSPFSDDMPRCELMLNGEPTGVVVDGAVLELAIRWHDLLLLFVTDNIMHEETLRIYLFNAKLNIVDSAKLGWMYATGVFSLIGLSPPNIVRFFFFGDTDWSPLPSTLSNLRQSETGSVTTQRSQAGRTDTTPS